MKNKNNISAVILAAGFGMRLKNNIPKALTKIYRNKTILAYQVNAISKYISIDNILVVVGYKKELIMEQHPELIYIYNEAYNRTNTGKSLLKALVKIKNGSILWVNGDVIFDEEIIPKIINKTIRSKKSCILVDNKKCGKEEVKYNVDALGNISSISKEIKDAKGEALGINLCIEDDLPLLIHHLMHIDDHDYFEKAIENMISKNCTSFIPVNTGNLFCQEIDFLSDLKSVRNYLQSTKLK